MWLHGLVALIRIFMSPYYISRFGSIMVHNILSLVDVD